MSNGNEHWAKLKQAVESVSDSLDADVILYSGPIRHGGDDDFLEKVGLFQSRPNVLLMLTTLGGSPDFAYRISRCLQRSYADGKFILFLHSYCKSAGTLIAVGTDEIIMCDGAQLGPLDIQLSKPDELGEQMSGLTVLQTLATIKEQAFDCMEHTFLNLRFQSGMQITTKTALHVAVEFATGLYSPLVGQVDPLGVGENQRANSIGEEYGKRLSDVKKNLKERSLYRLIHDYPSHGFVIDREEAAKYLFNEVREPSESELNLATLVRPLVESGAGDDAPVVQFLSAYFNFAETKGETNDSKTGESGAVPQTASQSPGADVDKPTDKAEDIDQSTVSTIGNGEPQMIATKAD